jgi:hypothetical protein
MTRSKYGFCINKGLRIVKGILLKSKIWLEKEVLYRSYPYYRFMVMIICKK